MKEAFTLFMDYHKINSQKNTIRAYGLLLAKFRDHGVASALSSGQVGGDHENGSSVFFPASGSGRSNGAGL
jgi:hypothetical protein